MDNILQIQGLCKSYKGFELKDVSFELPRGYIMGFVGQNGSGKTTTIRSILNMTHIDSGKISVLGLDSVDDTKQIKNRTGVVFDSLCFAGHINAKQIERQLCGFFENWDKAGFFKRLNDFSLPDNKGVGDFSKGMKMKLMIAAALSHGAELLILDEPTSGLDPVARDELLEILYDFIQDENKGVLFSTHITADVEKVADYITVMQDGRVWYTGLKDELLEQYVIIKGSLADLPDDIKKNCIGLHNYPAGFDAMLDIDKTAGLPKSIEYDKITLDEMLVYIARGDRE